MANTPAEEQGFWNALQTNPNDNANYFAFADWLEEHNDPRAVYFRDPELGRRMQPDATDPVEALIGELRESTYDHNQSVRQLLTKVGAPAVPTLVNLVETGEFYQSSVAADALADMSEEALLPHLEMLVDAVSRDIPNRPLGRALTVVGAATAPHLLQLIETSVNGYLDSESFAHICTLLGPEAAPATNRLVEICCYGGDENAIPIAGQALAGIGPRTAEALVREFGRISLSGFSNLHSAFDGFGESAVPALRQGLEDADQFIRWGSALALIHYEPELALPHLIEGVGHADGEPLRENFLYAFEQAGTQASTAVPVLREILNRPDIDEFLGEDIIRVISLISQAGDFETELQNPDPTVRREVVGILGEKARKNDEAKQLLYRALQDADADVRVDVVAWLARVLRRLDDDAVEPLRLALHDADKRVREGAAKALGRLKSAAAPVIPDLIEAMHDPSAGVRAAAAKTIDGMEYETPEMLEALLKGLDDKKREVRENCAKGLRNWGRLFPGLTNTALALVTSKDSEIRGAVETLLEKYREVTPELVDYWKKVLRSRKKKSHRSAAAEGLGEAGIKDQSVIDDLFHFLDAGGEKAAEALVRLGPETLPDLDKRLRQQPKLRLPILEGLSSVTDQEELKSVLPGLLACLDDANSEVRKTAMWRLAALGPSAEAALPMLFHSLDAEDRYEQVAAVRALPAVAPDSSEVRSRILPLLTAEDDYVRGKAVDVLPELGLSSRQLLDHLQTALHDQAATVRESAVKVLAELESSTTVPGLIEALSNDEEKVRVPAIKALTALGADAAEAVPALSKLIDHPDNITRMRAIGALGAIGTKAKDTVPALVDLYPKEENKYVRHSIVEALGGIAHMPEKTVPILVEAMRADDCEEVRIEAAIAVGCFPQSPAVAEAVEVLRELLVADKGEIRGYAANGLGKLGSLAADAVPDLLAVLQNPAWGDIHYEMHQKNLILGQYALLPMDYVYSRGSVDQRIYVIYALGQIAPVPDVIAALGDMLGDDNEDLADTAVDALQSLRPAADPTLQQLAQSENTDVARRARVALME